MSRSFSELVDSAEIAITGGPASCGPTRVLLVFSGILPVVASLAAVASAWMLKFAGLVQTSDALLWLVAWAARWLGIPFLLLALFVWIAAFISEEDGVERDYITGYGSLGTACLAIALWMPQYGYHVLHPQTDVGARAANASSGPASAAQAPFTRRRSLPDERRDASQLAEGRTASVAVPPAPAPSNLDERQRRSFTNDSQPPSSR